MVSAEHKDLIQAGIDGELDARQRAELARSLLGDANARALHDDLRHLCAMLDAMPEVEPPAALKEGILGALPVSTVPLTRSIWSAPRWRYAALVAGVLVAGVVVFETVEGPGPVTTDVSGTMVTAQRVETVDTIRLEQGPVTGVVSLYRRGTELGLAFDLGASDPVDVLAETDGHTFRITDLGRDGSGVHRTVGLPGVGMRGQAVDLTLMVHGRQVGTARLRAPDGR